jgi:3-hydroxyisobutyrate dehydrogenase-like beta-hydroxyacid dehydrogenase
MKIGFIGLGRMGTAMATNLLKAGHQVTVYNRSPQKLRPLVELGARAASTADACRDGVVVTMLADDTDAGDRVRVWAGVFSGAAVYQTARAPHWRTPRPARRA